MWVGVDAEVFSRNFLLMLTWLNFLGCGMLSGGPMVEPVGAGDWVLPLAEDRPEVEDCEAGLASRERSAELFLASEAPSAPEFTSKLGFGGAGCALNVSSFSERCGGLRSVLAIDASRDAGRGRYEQQGSGKKKSVKL